MSPSKSRLHYSHSTQLPVRTPPTFQLLTCKKLPVHPTDRRRSLTDKLVPLLVELAVVGQAAFRHVQTEAVAGLDAWHAPARAALAHLHQRAVTAGRHVHLQGGGSSLAALRDVTARQGGMDRTFHSFLSLLH